MSTSNIIPFPPKHDGYYILYVITNDVNDISYIGRHYIRPNRSENDHYLGGGRDLKKAQDEIGRDHFQRKTLIRTNKGKRFANVLEQFLIETWPGALYNVAPGGDTPCESNRIAVSEDMKRRARLGRHPQMGLRRCSCIYCGKEVSVLMGHRWHFDNCPHKPVEPAASAE